MDRERLSRRLEDYLEAVLMLVRQHGSARVRDIAAATGVSKPTVTAALRQLSADGLVHYEAYEWITLTPRGRRLAGAVRQKHDQLVEFLTDVLGIDAPTAQANACRMEHVVDNVVLARLSALADVIRRRPAGCRNWLEAFADAHVTPEGCALPPHAKSAPSRPTVEADV